MPDALSVKNKHIVDDDRTRWNGDGSGPPVEVIGGWTKVACYQTGFKAQLTFNLSVL